MTRETPEAVARRTLFFWGLILANLFGVLVGAFYYQDQLASTPIVWWPFVPDCPLYVGLFALLIVLWKLGARSDWFGFLVSVGLLKYGAWTLFVLSYYGWFFLDPAVPELAVQSWFLFFLHIGMFAEGLVLTFRRERLGGLAVAAVLAWFLLNDFMDYFGPVVHPGLPDGADVAPAMWFAVIGSVAFTWLSLEVAKRKKGIRVAEITD